MFQFKTQQVKQSCEVVCGKCQVAIAHPADRGVRPQVSVIHFGFHDQLTICVMSHTSVLHNNGVIQTTWAKRTLNTMHKHSWIQQATSLQLQVFKEPGLKHAGHRNKLAPLEPFCLACSLRPRTTAFEVIFCRTREVTAKASSAGAN